MGTKDVDAMSLEELCKPLSARVMPRNAMAKLGPTGRAGNEMQSQRTQKRHGTVRRSSGKTSA